MENRDPEMDSSSLVGKHPRMWFEALNRKPAETAAGELPEGRKVEMETERKNQNFRVVFRFFSRFLLLLLFFPSWFFLISCHVCLENKMAEAAMMAPPKTAAEAKAAAGGVGGWRVGKGGCLLWRPSYGNQVSLQFLHGVLKNMKWFMGFYSFFFWVTRWLGTGIGMLMLIFVDFPCALIVLRI